MKIGADRLEVLAKSNLQSGAHDDLEDGACAMEMVAYLAEEEHSDAPECACPVLTSFVWSWNDSLSETDRNRLLKPLIPRLVGTRATKEAEERRGRMVLDWYEREFTPAWLDLVVSIRGHFSETLELPSIDATAMDASWTAARASAKATAWARRGGADLTVKILQSSAVALLERMIEVQA